MVSLVTMLAISLAPLFTASCRAHQDPQGEAKALETLRSMTRGGVLPAEDVVQRIENQFPNTRVAGLARFLRARIKLNAGDHSGAAGLLESSTIREKTLLGEYALLLRARALDQVLGPTEARPLYEQFVRDYPGSIRFREALLRNAEILLSQGQAVAIPTILQHLINRDDASALFLAGRAYNQLSDHTSALAAYRRLYFYAPASNEAAEAVAALSRLGSTTSPASAEEALARAERLFESKRYKDAAAAYGDAFSRFPVTQTSDAQLKRGIAASGNVPTAEAATILNAIPTSAGETRAQSLYYLAQLYANARQWQLARNATEELRKLFPESEWTPKALVNVGMLARDAKNVSDAFDLFRIVVDAYPGRAEVAQAQFELAWRAHESKSFQESSRLLTEHLAHYADKNTDNRGRSGYWAARDSERAGKLAEAKALYEAMLIRYDANWYGYLASQRLEVLKRNPNLGSSDSASNEVVQRAVANLKTVTVAEETVGAAERQVINKAAELSNVGADDLATEELVELSKKAPESPAVNLAIAKIFRSRNENVRALNTLRKSYPDYSQMKPEEMGPEEWDVFYPLAHWDIISQEARAKRLDPYQVAGLIRQESVFDPKARSSANAYGLMQLLVPTGRLVAQRYGVNRAITADALYEPRLNIQLGTTYMREQLDKYGRIEYAAAAYNAGPGRVVQWRSTLPLEIDEWTEAIPFRETRGYVQGVIRNTLQYRRLYNSNGNFKPEVGTRAVSGPMQSQPNGQTSTPDHQIIRKRRVAGAGPEE